MSMMRMMRRSSLLWAFLVVVACRPTESLVPSNLNIRLSFTPEKVSANTGTTVAVIEIDNFSHEEIRLEDVKISVSAGLDKAGAIVANGKNRFTAQLTGLTDASLSPVKVTVSIGKIRQTASLEIIAGNASNLVLTSSADMISADKGEVDLTVKIVDAHSNVASGAITLTTSAGVVSQLYQQADGTYKAKLTALVKTADSPVKITATAGDSKAETAVQILAGVLDHFWVEDIAATQVAGEFFPVAVSARDKNHNVVTAFENFAFVKTSRNTGDVEAAAFIGNSFTHNFVLGETPPGEMFRVKTAAPSPGITLVASDNAGHRGESNRFTVLPAAANQLLIYSSTGYNLIVSADGCTKPTPSSQLCVDDSRLATQLEIKLRRYVNSPEDSDAVASLLGGRGNDMLVTMRDAAGNVYDQTESDTEPFLGPVVDEQNGYYTVNVYNLRYQSQSPFTVSVRFVSLLAEIDVQIVPGDLDHFEFPPIPAQRMSDSGDPTGLLSSFFVTLTARDQWKNQVFAFQDTVSVFQNINGNLRATGASPSMFLGAAFPFLMTVPTAVGLPGPLNLFAQHGSGITGESNTFIAMDSLHTTTDFLVLLPGQYDSPPPDAPALANFFIGENALVTPPLGEISSAAIPVEQTVGVPFQIMILARTRGVALPVINFNGAVLLSGNNTGVEVVDNSCAFAGGANLSAPGLLTPDFIASSWTGASGFATRFESVCYVWVRATAANPAANIISDNNRSSSIPIQGNVSSNFRVKSAPATSVRIRNIPSPQLATADPEGGKATFSMEVQAYDALGNATDNINCSAPEFTDTLNALDYTDKAFDIFGKLTITDAWFDIAVSQNSPKNDRIHFTCGVAGMQADSNIFQIINQGATGYEITLSTNTVKAHEPFTFTATACGSESGGVCTAPASGFSYQVTMTDTTGTIFPRMSKPFQNGVLANQSVTLDRAGTGVRICLQGAGAYKCSDPITVQIGQLGSFRFEMAGFASVITVGTAYPIKVTPVDVGGNDMPDYTGRLYLNNNYGTAQFSQALNGNFQAADVTTGTHADGVPLLYYAGTPNKLSFKVLEMNSADFLSIGDNRGHSGFSLPHTYRVVYGPISSVEINESANGPCVNPADKVTSVRRGSYFNFCAVARTLGLDGVDRIKKDFNTTTAEVFSSPSFLPAPAKVTFVAGVAHQAYSFATDATSGDITAQYRLRIDGIYYPSTPLELLTKTPIAFSITSPTVLDPEIDTNEAFSLLLEIKNGSNLLDNEFRGALRVTDTTGSIRPVCGPGQKAGTCGHVAADGAVVTGDFTAPLFGQRDQWFSIPTENFATYIYVSDGFGKQLRLGPVDIIGKLDHFEIQALPNILAANNAYQLVVTAYDIDNNIMTNFNAPLQLMNQFGSINPDPEFPSSPRMLPPAFVNGVLNTTVTFYQANASTDFLTVTYNQKTGLSNTFTVQTRKLGRIAWDYVGQQPGYVDFDVTLRTYDQFDNQYFYGGTVNFSANGGYAVRPTQSTAFSNGVLTQKIALDGAPGASSVLTATGKEGSDPSVLGLSNAVTVTASAITNFAVTFASAAPRIEGCAYTLIIVARGAGNAQVNNFTGKVKLEWANSGVPTGNNNFITPVVSNNFVDGETTMQVTMTDQPDIGFFTTWGLYASIDGTTIQGSTPNFDLVTGTCP